MSPAEKALVAGLVLLAWTIRPARTRKQAAEGPPEPVQVAFCLELLALAMAAGAPATQAVNAVAQATSGRISDELRRVSAAMEWGVDTYRAWSAAPDYWQPAARAFNVSSRAGAAPSSLLRQAASDLRAAHKQRIATRAARLGVLVVLPLGLCFLPAFILLTIVPLVLGMVPSG